MILEFSAKVDYDGLLKFCHNCNLLVGFDYFVNAKSFWCCFDLALPAEDKNKNVPLSHLQMKGYDLKTIPTLECLLMDKFGLFYDLEKVATLDSYDNLELGSQGFWVDKFDAMGSRSYLLCCWAVFNGEADCHVVRAQGIRKERTWSFESFSAKHHESDRFGELLGKLAKITIFRLRLSQMPPNLKKHFNQTIERDRTLYCALVANLGGNSKSIVEHCFNTK
jgi:hypothetical protein